MFAHPKPRRTVSVAAMALSLAAAGLFATACTINLKNPKPSPYGHSDRGTVTITADAETCWSFAAYESGRTDNERARTNRVKGCGSREIAVRTAPAQIFSVDIVKSDDSPGPVVATLFSDGRQLDRKTATMEKRRIVLRG